MHKTLLCATVLAGTAAIAQGQTLLYQNTFNSGNGTAPVLGAGVTGGSLGVTAGLATQITFPSPGEQGTGFALNNLGPYNGSATTAATYGGSLSGLGNLSQFTLTMWLNPSASLTGENARILNLSTGAATDGDQAFLGVNSGGGIQFYGNNANDNAVGHVTTANPFAYTVGSWEFLGVTYSAGTANIYTATPGGSTSLLGTLVNPGDVSGGVNFGAGPTFISLLSRLSNQGRSFTGEMDDFSIYSGDLSQAQLDLIVQPAPEPGTMTLIGLGGAVLAGMVRRRRR